MGHEIRALSELQLQQGAGTLFEAWLTQARADAAIEVKDYVVDRVPDVPSIVSQDLTTS